MQKISIIIPHYNSVNKLKRLLQSIPISEYVEIIVVDDASDTVNFDEINKLINNYNIKFYRNEHNRGAGFCRNFGINVSNGDFILFADSDDYFINEFLIDFINKGIEIDADIVYYLPSAIHENTDIVSKRANKYYRLVKKYIYKPNKKNEIKLRCLFYAPWGKLYRKKFIINEEIKFTESKVSNDVIFSIKSGILAKKIDVINEKIYIVTESNDSLTKIRTKENNLERLKIYKDFIQLLQSKLSKSEIKHLKFFGAKYLYRYYKINKNIINTFKEYKELKKLGIGFIRTKSKLVDYGKK